MSEPTAYRRTPIDDALELLDEFDPEQIRNARLGELDID